MSDTAAAAHGEVAAADIDSDSEFVVDPAYTGPCRRESTREQRMTYLQQKRLRLDMLNKLGRWALGCIVVVAVWVLSEVRTKMNQTDDLRVATAAMLETLNTTVKKVGDTEAKVEVMVIRQQEDALARAKRDTEILLQLQLLNSQVEATRNERRIAGSRLER